MSEKQFRPESDPPPPYSGGPQPPYGDAAPPAGFQQPPAGFQQPPAGFQQPPAGFQQPPGVLYPNPPQPVSTMTTVIVTPMMNMGPMPVSMQCQSCSAQIVTEINYITGSLTWIICIVLLLFGLWCGCCLIPFCIPECQDVEHRCPNCKRVVGVYRRI